MCHQQSHQGCQQTGLGDEAGRGFCHLEEDQNAQDLAVSMSSSISGREGGVSLGEGFIEGTSRGVIVTIPSGLSSNGIAGLMNKQESQHVVDQCC